MKNIWGIIVLVLLIFTWALTTATFGTSWYRLHDELTNRGWAYFKYSHYDIGPDTYSISGSNIQKVLQTCLAFACISWIFTTVTIFINIMDRVKSGVSLFKVARFLPIGSFLFALFSVLVLIAWPKAFKKDCEKNASYLTWAATGCGDWGCFKDLRVGGDCEPYAGWACMIVSTITSFIAALISAIFTRYGVSA
ncbi:hypothetical protein PPL_05195 [Heterostelium album PN500]|uniref:Uncharacterized protein n=1 Tax=Heterostelium pallidum (strain ATCC 26659 / Pp 5 / PN500) TaxID=670386 RepID=D3B9P9_HETP5|nr:hypothetical protein PPL_05195 [Heterostelium album PN500]EFA81961.1 hypothetical protein PPL_05195 [Heterostelium album PN500]|eukprot:XP_020434078.1 hypothetical protein PPL_05195 [Heterostelium album PN500]